MTFRVIPVPIPNTEVKPKCAENTCGLPCWEDRLSLDFFCFLNYNILNYNIKIFKSKKIDFLFLNVFIKCKNLNIKIFMK